MASKDGQSRPLLFINSDPTDHGSTPHRRAIYQHVQLRYAKWKRVNDAREMRASVKKTSATDDGDMSSRSSSQRSSSNSNDRRRVSRPHQTAAQSLTEPSKEETVIKYRPKPSTILRHGNSDPFGTLAVKVGPKVNALMQYTRDYYLPGIQRDINNPGVKVIGPEWAQCISFLQDEGLAFSHFARVAAVIASDRKQSMVSEDFRTQALIFKSKSLALLRGRLEESPQDPKTYNQILLLMNAEIFDQNFPAASSHAMILANLLQNGTITADHAFLFKALYHDAQRAAMSLTRPSFDVETWVPAKFAPISDLVTSRLPPTVLYEAAARGLDPLLEANPSLKHSLTLFRHSALCLFLYFSDKSYAEDIQLVFLGRVNMTLSMDRFINTYLDSEPTLANSSSRWIPEDHATTSARAWAIISLAAILVLRCLTRIDSVHISGNIAIFDANELIIRRLRDALLTSDQHSVAEMKDEFANAKLYALFVGAWLEQAKAEALSTSAEFSPAEHGWFNIEFAEQARTMKLYQWADVRKVLLGFAYADVLQPSGAEWFPFIMNATESPESVTSAHGGA